MIRFDNHAFKDFDSSLKQLFELQQAMAEATRKMMALLPEALKAVDPELFQAAKAIDKTVNEAEHEAEKLVSQIISKFGASGEDLRFLIGSIKVSGTLERVADKTKNCIKRLGRLSKPLPAEVKAELERAVQSVQAMIPLALAQVVDYQDVATRELLHHGALVQDAYRSVLLKLHASMHEDEVHLMLVAKNLEQAADMLVEIMKIGHTVNFGTKYEKEPA